MVILSLLKHVTMWVNDIHKVHNKEKKKSKIFLDFRR